MNSISTIRWIMVAVTAALVVALIARGDVVIAVLLGALLVMRVMLLVRLQQRRDRFRQRRQGGGAPGR